MNQVPQHLIDEATRRGIVPGATIRSTVDPEYGGIVPPVDEWVYRASGAITVGFCSLLTKEKGWATVITPAPTNEGLKEGDACETGPAMRAAIIELAKELGVPAVEPYEIAIGCAYVGQSIVNTRRRNDTDNLHPPEAFIAKMRATAKKPKPIRIGDYNVDFVANGDVKVGCTRVDYATLKEVYERATKNTI